MVAAEFRLDPVAAWFLVMLSLAGIPVCLFVPDYMQHVRDRADMPLFWGSLTLLLVSMPLVVMAANALTLLVSWELMSLSSFVLVGTDHIARARAKPHSSLLLPSWSPGLARPLRCVPISFCLFMCWRWANSPPAWRL
jgi:NADH:ubiquinone oxidoreductase subunit 5 (subunit L)/multisubunit Na+/H+ antiporter MnhA subunit